jgi:ankyrin repeat protein
MFSNSMLVQRGRTAIMIAAANGHIECVTVLLNAGADVDAADEVNKECFDKHALFIFE